MKKVGYFCTAGYTELGGLKAFLSKIRPFDEVNWVRCFPIGVKKNLKVGRTNTTPVASGTTGNDLINEMIKILEKCRDHQFWGEAKYDYLLVIDDADCRFNGADNIQQAMQDQVQEWQARVDEVFAGGDSIPLLVLFAAPEVEAWFVADWENSFQFEYKADVAGALKHHIYHTILQGIPVESYGGQPVYTSGRAACTIKLSDQIIASFQMIPAFATDSFQTIFATYPTNKTYNKNRQGSGMLSRIEPECVARTCTLYFDPVYRQLQTI